MTETLQFAYANAISDRQKSEFDSPESTHFLSNFHTSYQLPLEIDRTKISRSHTSLRRLSFSCNIFLARGVSIYQEAK